MRNNFILNFAFFKVKTLRNITKCFISGQIKYFFQLETMLFFIFQFGHQTENSDNHTALSLILPTSLSPDSNIKFLSCVSPPVVVLIILVLPSALDTGHP